MSAAKGIGSKGPPVRETTFDVTDAGVRAINATVRLRGAQGPGLIGGQAPLAGIRFLYLQYVRSGS
jgi:hypothetical protein